MKVKRNIIVADAISTGQYYIGDIIKRNYNPVILKSILPSKEQIERGEKVYKELPYDVDFIDESLDYRDTLKMVKALDPVIVLAGTEATVELATRLSEDLNLPGNPTSIIPAMTEKPAMHEALKKAGLRYIKGEVINSVNECLDYYRKNGLERVVIKPVKSSASQGLFFCDSLEELETAATELFSMNDLYGNPIKSIIIQERIIGIEYIVNTVSCRGKHKLSSVLKYTKVPTKEGGNIYDYLTTVVDLEPGYSDMISYAFKVADAIGYQYGEIHGEYIIDEKGPVLIEVNCRPMGGSCPPQWLDMVYGQHETDSILDAYLEPEYFLSTINEPYHPHRMAGIKFIMVPENTEVESLPISQIAKNLRSFHKISAGADHTRFTLPKTRDMETAGGAIYLVHDDAKVVEDDIRLLKEIEKNDFELIVNDGASRPWFKKDEKKMPMESLIKDMGCHGSILVLTDDEEDVSGARVLHYDGLKDTDIDYKNVIIDISSSILERDESKLLEMLFDIMKRVQIDGRVIFTPRCYYYLTDKKKGAEILLRVLGYRIEAPLFGQDELLTGTRVHK